MHFLLCLRDFVAKSIFVKNCGLHFKHIFQMEKLSLKKFSLQPFFKPGYCHGNMLGREAVRFVWRNINL